MFKLVWVQDGGYAVHDAYDDSVDFLEKSELCKCLNLGVQVGGVTKVSETDFTYTEEFFPVAEETQEEPADDGYWDDEDEDWFGDGSSDAVEDTEQEYTDPNAEWDSEEEAEDYFGDGSSAEVVQEEEEVQDPNAEWDSDEEAAEYFGDGSAEESSINKLYRYLNDDQRELLKRYYLWFSQRMFADGKKNAQNSLRNAPTQRRLKTKQTMDALRGTSAVWIYAGFIDLGYKDAGNCDLGHGLRYLHIAWDLSTGDLETFFFGENYDLSVEQVISENRDKCILFGRTCIVEFFEIPPEYSMVLQKEQDRVYRDMKTMLGFYEAGTVADAINSFSVMDEVAGKIYAMDARDSLLNPKHQWTINKDIALFYRQFRKLGVVPPKSLIQEMRDSVVGWPGHVSKVFLVPNWDHVDAVLKKVLHKDIVRGIPGYGSFDSKVKHFLTDFLHLRACGVYEYLGTKESKDEGGARKSCRLLLHEIKRDATTLFFKDAEYTYDYVSRVVDFAVFARGFVEKLAKFRTPRIMRDGTDGVHYRNIEYAPELNRGVLKSYDQENGTELYSFVPWWGDGHLSELAREMSGSATLASMQEKIEGYMKVADAEVDKYLAYEEKLFQDMVAKDEAEIALLKKEEEAVPVHKTKEEVIDFCWSHISDAREKGVASKSLDILNSVHKWGKCSKNQWYHVALVYEGLTGKKPDVEVVDERVKLDDRKDIEDLIVKVSADNSLLDGEKHKQLILDIFETIKKKREISESQMKYVVKAMDFINKKVVKEGGSLFGNTGSD